jgi:hypothetical protein
VVKQILKSNGGEFFTKSFGNINIKEKNKLNSSIKALINMKIKGTVYKG